MNKLDEAKRSYNPISFINGWYFVASEKDLKPGKKITVKMMNKEVVILCNENKQVYAVDAQCPILEKHYGVGNIKKRALRFPYSDLTFSPNGKCVFTARTVDGTKEDSATVSTFPTMKANGVIWIYMDGNREDPTWDIKEFDMTGWSPIEISRTVNLTANIQEVGENPL